MKHNVLSTERAHVGEDRAGRDLVHIFAGVRCVLTKPKEWEALPDEEQLDATGRNKSHWYGSRERNCLRTACVRAVWEGVLYERAASSI